MEVAATLLTFADELQVVKFCAKALAELLIDLLLAAHAHVTVTHTTQPHWLLTYHA